MKYVVSVSGGKDSTACALLAVQHHAREDIRLVFADTGNEHPITLEYLDRLGDRLGVTVDWVCADFTRLMAGKRKWIMDKWAGDGVSQEKIDRALAILQPTGNAYLDMCLWKGRFPSRMVQFCTERLKTEPMVEYQIALMDEFGSIENWQGVRADESLNRRDLAHREYRGDGLTIYRPILHWTAQQTIDYSRRYGVELNPLYKLGMGRVGCMPCINARKSEVREIARRFPDVIERIEDWEALVKDASKQDGASFFHRPDGQGIRRYVEWSRTLHGGKEVDETAMEEAPVCASSYGLCE